MMRFLIFIAILYSFFELNAQYEVGFGNYDPFYDTTKILQEHTSVKPVARTNIEPVAIELFINNKKNSDGRVTTIFPVINQIGAATITDDETNTSFRSGIGAGITITDDKFFARTTLVGSYYERNHDTDLRNSILPNTYFWNGNDKIRREVQALMRASYTPNKFFNFQAGIDHNFIGEGNRSMILGDYTAPYPFAQIRSSIWHFEFVNLYQFFREQKGGGWINKFASSHFLNFQATERLQFGVFESVIFEPKDTLLTRGYEWEYLNPFLFYRPIEYSIGSQDKIILGTHFSYNLDFMMLYGQFVLDEFVLHELVDRTRWWGNKYAGQIGLKGKIKTKKGLFSYQTELNFARPFIYTHVNHGTNYAHQGIPLAHPLGANFVESYSNLKVDFKNSLSIRAELMVVQQGGQDPTDPNNYGSDIYISYADKPFEYGYFIGGHGKLNRTRLTTEISYLILPEYKIKAFIRPAIEWQSGVSNQQILLVFGGIRSNLWNERSFSF